MQQAKHHLDPLLLGKRHPHDLDAIAPDRENAQVIDVPGNQATRILIEGGVAFARSVETKFQFSGKASANVIVRRNTV